MAFNLKRSEREPISEINVTPFDNACPFNHLWLLHLC